jgi:hypothetical protein
MRAALLAIVLAAAVAACGGSPLGTEYEYEEDLTLSMDGSATLVVNASVLALDALKGFSLNPDPAARGNILTWEQRLRERLAGKPIAYAEDRTPDVMEARMDRQSILYRTLWLFGIAFLAAILVIAGLIWLTMRRGAPGSSDLPRSA